MRVLACVTMMVATASTAVAVDYAQVAIMGFNKPEVLLFGPDCRASTGQRRGFSAEEIARFQNTAKDTGQTCVRFDLDGQTYFVKPSVVATNDRGTTSSSMCADTVASLSSDRKDAGAMGSANLQTGKLCDNTKK